MNEKLLSFRKFKEFIKSILQKIKYEEGGRVTASI